MEACGPGPIICHGTFRKAVSTLVMQIGRGLIQGVRALHNSGKAAGRMVVGISFRKSQSTGIRRKLLPLISAAFLEPEV